MFSFEGHSVCSNTLIFFLCLGVGGIHSFESVHEYRIRHKNSDNLLYRKNETEGFWYFTLWRYPVKDLLFCHSVKTDLTLHPILWVICRKYHVVNPPYQSCQTKEPVNSNEQTKAKQRGFIRPVWHGRGAFSEWIHWILGLCVVHMTQVVSDRPWGDLQAKLPGNVCDANSRNGTTAILRFTPPLVDNLIQ